tara:strand:- start:1185 stop:1679 length:495 start_codon:yes stop_codon:yes gene_type:complete
MITEYDLKKIINEVIENELENIDINKYNYACCDLGINSSVFSSYINLCIDWLRKEILNDNNSDNLFDKAFINYNLHNHFGFSNYQRECLIIVSSRIGLYDDEDEKLDLDEETVLAFINYSVNKDIAFQILRVIEFKLNSFKESDLNFGASSYKQELLEIINKFK